MEKKRIDAMLMNTGRDVTMAIREDPSNYITILTGPFSYRFRIYQLKIHFGTVDNAGSEHTIGGQSFAAEIHLIAYNTDLYDNYTSALASPHGIVAIAIFAMLGGKNRNEFDVIGKEFENIRFKGGKRNISQVLLADIIPKTDHYMTYEGSLTQPGCQETVTWIILNKPIYVTKTQMRLLRKMNQEETPGSILLGNNLRPTMPLNRRTIRTNISPEGQSKECSIKKELFYTEKVVYHSIITKVGEKYQGLSTKKTKIPTEEDANKESVDSISETDADKEENMEGKIE